jgi:hypothetical protein
VANNTFPPYLEQFQQMLLQIASKKAEVRPKKFPNNIRIYIFDQRLFIPLILVDQEGDIANYCYKFTRYSFDPDYHSYGELAPLPGEPWDKDFLNNFAEQYGFVPVEDIASPALVIFVRDKLDQRRLLNPWQMSFLLMKYHDQNLVDWESRLADSRYEY